MAGLGFGRQRKTPGDPSITGGSYCTIQKRLAFVAVFHEFSPSRSAFRSHETTCCCLQCNKDIRDGGSQRHNRSKKSVHFGGPWKRYVCCRPDRRGKAKPPPLSWKARVARGAWVVRFRRESLPAIQPIHPGWALQRYRLADLLLRVWRTNPGNSLDTFPPPPCATPYLCAHGRGTPATAALAVEARHPANLASSANSS